MTLISTTFRRWPDQLKPLEEIFGFFAHRGYYNGVSLLSRPQCGNHSLNNRPPDPLSAPTEDRLASRVEQPFKQTLHATIALQYHSQLLYLR